MSLLHADNFNLYGVGGHNVTGNGRANALSGVYVQFGQASNFNGCAMVADPDPTSNLYSVARFVPQAGARHEVNMYQLRKVLATAKTTVGMFARLWWDSFAPSRENGPMIRFADNSNVTNIWLQVSPIGSILVWQGIFNNAEPTLLYESAVCLTAAAWHHIEAKILFDNAVGTVEVRVNGLTVVDLSAQDTAFGAANCQNVCVASRSSGVAQGGNIHWKDFVVWDTAGTVNNDFFGTCAVEAKMPTGDVAFPWSASTGTTGYNLIDEVNGLDNADYIFAGDPPPALAEFNVENVSADVTSIRGMMMFAAMAKSDGGDCQVQIGIKSNGVAGLGADRAITTAFTYWNDVFEVDPNTGVAFTPTAFNLMTVTTNRTL